MKTRVYINDVAVRDGFQIEKDFVPTETKVDMIDALSQTGLAKIEVASFVNPKLVPNMRDGEQVLAQIRRKPGKVILEGVGENPEREGLRETPRRVAEMYAELTAGMREDPSEHIVPLSGNKHDEMVIVKDIHIASLCEHHLAPFVGKCHIAYIPKNGRIIGVSKLARLSETFARRLQLQERLTSEIANTLFDRLQPLGVMVVIEAEHTCMTLRGVKKSGAMTVTSAVLGGFRKDPRTRAEAMALITGKNT